MKCQFDSLGVDFGDCNEISATPGLIHFGNCAATVPLCSLHRKVVRDVIRIVLFRRTGR